MSKDIPKIEECFYGSAMIGERGQVVIPAEARKDCGIHSGDKLLVFRHPMYPNMLILSRIAEMQQVVHQMNRAVEHFNRQISEVTVEDQE